MAGAGYRTLIIGCDAAETLARRGRAGRVAAVFRRSFYLVFEDEWICLGAPQIGAGPLNLLCDISGAADWRDRLEAGLPVVPAENGFSVAGAFRITLENAAVWAPPPAPALIRERTRRGLDALESTLSPDLPEDGLACYLRAKARPIGLVAEAARAPVGMLAAWLEPGPRRGSPGEPVAGLIGLGPGLTPSGDDFLGGCLCTLRALGEDRRADALAECVRSRAGDATTALSRAHLEAAARGRLSGRLHDVLNDIIAGDGPAVSSGLAALARAPGQNSPWDGLAGIAVTLRAALTGGRFIPSRSSCGSLRDVNPSKHQKSI